MSLVESYCSLFLVGVGHLVDCGEWRFVGFELDVGSGMGWGWGMGLDLWMGTGVRGRAGMEWDGWIGMSTGIGNGGWG